MRRWAGLVALSLASLSLWAPLTIADGHQEWANEDREIVFHSGSGGFDFQSQRSSDRGDDRFTGTFAVAGARYTATFVDNQHPEDPGLLLVVDFQGLIEFRDMDGSGAYSLGDHVVQQVRMEDLGSPAIDVAPYGDGGRLVTLQYLLPPPTLQEDRLVPGKLLLRFWILPAVGVVDGETVPPVETKLEVQVHDFPYQLNSTRLGWETRVQSNQALQQDSKSVAVESSALSLSYRWPSQGTVDGIVKPVRVTLVASGSAGDSDEGGPAVVVHSFERGDVITHEPSVGAEPDAESWDEELAQMLVRGDWRFYLAGVLVAGILVAVTVWRRIGR